jgi:chemotaxis protein MotB
MRNKIKSKTKEHKRHNTKQERYLITYADLLTLLFALFIILYSISKPDVEKANEILMAMNNIFNPNQIIEGNNLNPNIASSQTAPVIFFPEKPVQIPEIQAQIEESLNHIIKNNTIGFEKLPNGLKLVIPNKFLFQSAKATLLPESNDILDTIANAIKELDMQIQVDGHTDAVPIKSFMYESNWQLSAARAVNVAQNLINKGVHAHNVVIRAFGEQRPIADNVTEEGKEQNRRVEIVITPKDANVATTGEE